MGDQRRWAAVCAHRERLLRIARARVDDPHDAEDCVQEAMLRCVEFADLDEARLGQFLTTVTVRLCADVHRGRARSDRLASRLTAFWGSDPGPEEAVCDRAESAWLSGRLAALTPHQRRIVEARAEGLSCGAVAERLTVPYTTVESALARVRRSLRTALDATLGLVPAPGWVRLRRLLAGGAVAAGALTVAGPVLPGGGAERPAPPPVRVAAPPRPVVVAPAAAPVAGARPAVAAPRAAAPAVSAPVPATAAPPAATRRTGAAYVAGRPVVGQRHKDHPYTDAERAQHCLRYGAGVGRTVQCRYPPGDPYNEPEWVGTPNAEGEPR